MLEVRTGKAGSEPGNEAGRGLPWLLTVLPHRHPGCAALAHDGHFHLLPRLVGVLHLLPLCHLELQSLRAKWWPPW